MNSKFLADFSKPTILTAQHYDRKITVEIDHSDTDLDEIMDGFETLIIGMGYHQNSWKQWILERAAEYQEEEDNKWEDDEFEYLRHNTPKVNDEEENEFFGKYDIDETGAYHTNEDWDEERYRATDEDESEFDDYGKRIHPTFEWGDEPEEDIEPLFDGDEWEANENLKAANERYKSEVKKMNIRQKRNSK